MSDPTEFMEAFVGRSLALRQSYRSGTFADYLAGVAQEAEGRFKKVLKDAGIDNGTAPDGPAEEVGGAEAGAPRSDG